MNFEGTFEGVSLLFQKYIKSQPKNEKLWHLNFLPFHTPKMRWNRI